MSKGHIFTLGETAMAYAVSAERMFARDASFLNANPACIPLFVSFLFQSLEVSIKHAGVESGLFTIDEIRKQRIGHKIEKLATLACERLGGQPYAPILTAMTTTGHENNSRDFISKMICGKELAKTREAYSGRQLGYAEVADGDFALAHPVADWVAAVKEIATNLPVAIDTISQWKQSPSNSKHFAVWFAQRHT